MPTCPSCQRGYQPGRRYCGGCRASLARVCTTCAFVNEHDDAWCGGCARSVKTEARFVPASTAPAAAVQPRPAPQAQLPAPVRTPTPPQPSIAPAAAIKSLAPVGRAAPRPLAASAGRTGTIAFRGVDVASVPRPIMPGLPPVPPGSGPEEAPEILIEVDPPDQGADGTDSAGDPIGSLLAVARSRTTTPQHVEASELGAEPELEIDQQWSFEARG